MKKENVNVRDENVKEEIIVIEDPETMTGDYYFGEIAQVYDGYVFIKNVKRAYESIVTNGDVFAPIPKDMVITAGQIVGFAFLDQDEERPGKFRTEGIAVISEDDVRVSQLMTLSKTLHPYHQMKKEIAEIDLNKAVHNRPLQAFVRMLDYFLNHNTEHNPEDIIGIANNFIEKHFTTLASSEVQFKIQGFDLEEERKKMEETKQECKDLGLDGQVESLALEYDLFCQVREALSMMNEHGSLSVASLMPLQHLPELTVAFPVWYLQSKKEQDLFVTKEKDPQPDNSTKFFCDCVGSDEYAWFYQLYNRRSRSVRSFQGKDIMPQNLIKQFKRAKEIFDYIAIMTPYHDQASKEWSDPDWLRNIDPVMVGFIKDVPFMFVLGRWSGTGVFPLLLDCIADTANHLKLNKHLLRNFLFNSYWYKGWDSEMLSDSENDNRLESFADAFLKAYEDGVVFEFLRGELSEKEPYSIFQAKPKQSL